VKWINQENCEWWWHCSWDCFYSFGWQNWN